MDEKDEYESKLYDCKFKILIIGDNNVGKTSLMLRFVDHTFSENYIATIGIDLKSKIVEVEGVRANLQIWDTAGQERFRSLTKAYYRGVSGAIVVYDVQNMESFSNAEMWIRHIKHNCKNAVVVLVGNKDDSDKKVVKVKDGQKLANQFKISLFETSAKENKNVDEMFTEISRQIVRLFSHNYDKGRDNDVIKPSDINREKEEKVCC